MIFLKKLNFVKAFVLIKANAFLFCEYKNNGGLK
jgi:hypothetical protein